MFMLLSRIKIQMQIIQMIQHFGWIHIHITLLTEIQNQMEQKLQFQHETLNTFAEFKLGS